MEKLYYYPPAGWAERLIVFDVKETLEVKTENANYIFRPTTGDLYVDEDFDVHHKHFPIDIIGKKMTIENCMVILMAIYKENGQLSGDYNVYFSFPHDRNNRPIYPQLENRKSYDTTGAIVFNILRKIWDKAMRAEY